MRTVAACLVVVVAIGCDGRPPIEHADASVPDADTGPPREVIGTVEVIEDSSVYDDGTGPVTYYRSSVFGQLFQDHGFQFHREVMQSGACWLRTYTPSQCTPACVDGLCVETDVCEPWPTRVSAGRLTLTGLAVPLAIDYEGGYYFVPTALPEDLFADSAIVTAGFAGADLPPMSLAAGGVESIAPQIQNGKITIPYPAGQDVVIRWTPGATEARVHVTYNSNNQGHGSPFFAILECDVPDSAGEVAILPAAMLDAFPETRAWTICAGSDCPPSTIRRYHRGTAPVGDQDVELIVGSQVSFGVEHIVE